MAIVSLPALPSEQIPQVIRSMVPEYLEVGGYRLTMNHQHNALVLQELPNDSRWIFTNYHQYSLFLLLVDRLASMQEAKDYVSMEEGLRVVGLWTGQNTREERRKLCKHVYKLKNDLSPWFQIQGLTSGQGALTGYRLVSTSQPHE